MNCVFRHKFSNQYIVNYFGNVQFTDKRDRATVYNAIEKETLAARLNIKASELIAEPLT